VGKDWVESATGIVAPHSTGVWGKLLKFNAEICILCILPTRISSTGALQHVDRNTEYSFSRTFVEMFSTTQRNPTSGSGNTVGFNALSSRIMYSGGSIALTLSSWLHRWPFTCNVQFQSASLTKCNFQTASSH